MIKGASDRIPHEFPAAGRPAPRETAQLDSLTLESTNEGLSDEAGCPGDQDTFHISTGAMNH